MRDGPGRYETPQTNLLSAGRNIFFWQAFVKNSWDYGTYYPFA